MVDFVVDTFNVPGGSNIFLTNHTGETGATWVAISGHTTPNVSWEFDQVFARTGAGGAYASGTPTNADYTVEADIVIGSSDPGVIARYDTSTGHFYLVHVSGTDLELYRFDGSYNLIGSTTISGNALLKLVVDSSNIEVWYDGVKEIDTTDSNLTAAGNAGLRIFGTNSTSRIDNFKATDIGGGATVTGTAITGGVTESEIVTGGETIIITLTGDTWVATVGDDNTITDALIAGITSAQSETFGWNNVVRANMVFGDVARTSDTIVTITLAAEATYSITANETITITIPATALTAAAEIVATPTFDVTNEGAFLAAWANSSNVLLQPGVAA